MKQEATIKGHKVTLEAIGVEKRPDYNGDKYAFHYQIEVTVDGKSVYSGPYSTGSGNVARFLKEKYPEAFKGCFNPMSQNRTIFEVETFDKIRTATMKGKDKVAMDGFKVFYPSIDDVLWLIFVEGAGIDSFTTFEDWASELGYDTDSRKALSTFETCRETAIRLRAVFDSDYDGLMDHYMTM